MGASARHLHLVLLPGQALGLKKLFEEQRRHLFLVGGVGGGKTRFVAQAATMLAYANPPGVPGLAISPTFGMMADVLEPTLEEFWEENDIPFRHEKGRRIYILPETGSVIRCRSADRWRRLVGSNIGWAVWDEVCYTTEGERVLKVVQARIRHPRAAHRALVGATTPNGFDFLYERVADPNRPKEWEEGYAYVHASTRDNSFVLDADPRFVNRLEESYDPELAQQEIDGLFVNIGMGGRPYYPFDRNVHLKANDYDPKLPLSLYCDFNVDPMTWGVLQDPGRGRGRVRVIDEIAAAVQTEVACKEFIRRYPQGVGTVKVYGDASGNSRKTTGQADWEVIRQMLKVAPHVGSGNPPVLDRIAAVNARLKNAKGEIGMEIHPTKCPELVKDLEQCRFLKGTRELDKSDRKRTHSSDGLGYWAHWEYPVRAAADEAPQRQRLIERLRAKRRRRV